MNVERAAIVGIGTVSALGSSLDELRAALLDGRPRTVEVEGAGRSRGARRAALCGDVGVRERIPMLAARRMSRASRRTVVAARLALEHARVETPAERAGEPDGETSITVANAFGPILHSQTILDQLVEGGFRNVLPAGFTECVANAPPANVAIQCRLGGACRALVGREAGALLALHRGAADVARGRARRALAGYVEDAPPLLHRTLDRFRALARGRNGSSEAARPLDLRRNGFLLAEGSTMAVLEAERDARRRGVPILARLLASGSGFDPSASRSGWGGGAPRLADAIRAELESQGIALSTIDAVVSGASGARAGDLLEGRVLRSLWPERMPPVLAPKSVTGEYGGAFLAAALLALEGVAPGSGGESHHADPAVGIEPLRDASLPPPNRILVTTVASGGLAAWAILERASA